MKNLFKSINIECPIYLRNHGGEKKWKKDRKKMKAYISWDDSASTTSNSSSDEEIASVLNGKIHK